MARDRDRIMCAPFGNKNACKNKPPPPKYKLCKCGNKLSYNNKSGFCNQCRRNQYKKLKEENQYFNDIEQNRKVPFTLTPQKIEQWLSE
jgi:hypothetical protein